MHETVVIELGAIPPPELRGNSGWVHKMKVSRAKTSWRTSGFQHGIGELKDWHLVPRISLQFTFHHWRKIDLDNLMMLGPKAFIDGMMAAEVCADDTPDHVRLEAPEFVKCRKLESKTVVTVREIAP